MIDQIKKLDGWDSLTKTQIRAAWSESVNVRLEADATKNNTAWATGARGLKDFGPGPNGWGGMKSKLVELGYDDVAEQLTNGMDFGDPLTQSMLDQLGQVASDVFTSERVATMKAWGVAIRTRYAVDGGTGDIPTEEAIQTELNRYAAELEVEAVKVRADAAYEAAKEAYRSNRFDSITSEADAAYAG